jgi:hypothetical protein
MNNLAQTSAMTRSTSRTRRVTSALLAERTAGHPVFAVGAVRGNRPGCGPTLSPL